MKILYFAWVRERVGAPEEDVAIPPGIATVGALVAWLRTRGENYADAFEGGSVVRAALDRVHVKHDAPLAGAREIAFFPPMTGG